MLKQALIILAFAAIAFVGVYALDADYTARHRNDTPPIELPQGIARPDTGYTKAARNELNALVQQRGVWE